MKTAKWIIYITLLKSILLRLLQPVFARRANTVVEALSATRRPPPPPPFPVSPPPTPPPRFAQRASIPQVVPTTSSCCYQCMHNRRQSHKYRCLNPLPHHLLPYKTTKMVIDILVNFWYERICLNAVTYVVISFFDAPSVIYTQWLPQGYRVCFTFKWTDSFSLILALLSLSLSFVEEFRVLKMTKRS